MLKEQVVELNRAAAQNKLLEQEIVKLNKAAADTAAAAAEMRSKDWRRPEFKAGLKRPDMNTADLNPNSQRKRRALTNGAWDDFGMFCGRIHLPAVPVPPISEDKNELKARAQYIADGIFASQSGAMRSATLRTHKKRIDRIAHYVRYRKESDAKKRQENRMKRDSSLSKMMAAVLMYSTSGSVRVYQSYRWLSRQVTGDVSSLPTAKQISEGAYEIASLMDNAIKIRACRDGHFVSLRSVAEMEVLHHEQSPPTRPTKRNSKGVSRTAEVKPRFGPKTLSSAQFTADKQAAAFAEEAARNAAARPSGSAPPPPAVVQEAANGEDDEDDAPAARDDAPAAREKQPEYMLKLSFDTRRSSELFSEYFGTAPI